jgi:hypothetical protein
VIKAICSCLVLATVSQVATDKAQAQDDSRQTVKSANYFLAHTMSSSTHLFVPDTNGADAVIDSTDSSGCTTHVHYTASTNANGDAFPSGSIYIDWSKVNSVRYSQQTNASVGIDAPGLPNGFYFFQNGLNGPLARISNAMKFLWQSCNKVNSTGF